MNVINNMAQMNSVDSDRPLYIYGAKTNAIRVYRYIEENMCKDLVKGFLVSNMYDNPYKLCNKIVYRIEELEPGDVNDVIIAVGWEFIEEVVKDLSKYAINNISVISPLFFDSCLFDKFIGMGCKVSNSAAVSANVRIFADESSEIIVEDWTVIGAKVSIYATHNSKIIIKEHTKLDSNVVISVENGTLTIGDYSYIGEKSSIFITNYSSIVIGKKLNMEEKSNLTAKDNGRVCFGNNIYLAEKAYVQSYSDATVSIAHNLQLHEGASILADKESMIQIGYDVLLNRNVSICARNNGEMHIGNGTVIGNNSSCGAVDDGVVDLGSNLNLGSDGTLGAEHGALIIGDNTTISSLFYISCCCSKIEIGEDNMYSFFVKMNTGHHEIIDRDTGEIIDNTMPIVIGRHVWLGMGATLLPGCVIGEGCIVGATTIVNKEISSNSICVGGPAKVIRKNVEWNRVKNNL